MWRSALLWFGLAALCLPAKPAWASVTICLILTLYGGALLISKHPLYNFQRGLPWTVALTTLGGLWIATFHPFPDPIYPVEPPVKRFGEVQATVDGVAPGMSADSLQELLGPPDSIQLRHRLRSYQAFDGEVSEILGDIETEAISNRSIVFRDKQRVLEHARNIRAVVARLGEPDRRKELLRSRMLDGLRQGRELVVRL